MCSTGLPDPFAKISVDGSGQVYSTNAVKGTLDPKWNTHYDLYLTKGDGITIRSVVCSGILYVIKMFEYTYP